MWRIPELSSPLLPPFNSCSRSRYRSRLRFLLRFRSCSRLRFRYRSSPRSRPPSCVPSPVCVSVLTPGPSLPSSLFSFPFPLRPRSHARSHHDPAAEDVTVPAPVWFFPSLDPGSPLGTVRLYRDQVLLTELLGVRKCHSLSAEIVPLTE